MGERRGTKGLELWCRRITDGYSGVNVQNMTTSWRDGLAFCAMIHHFRPDLIDFSSLNKDDIYRNNELAFRTAEQHLGIPALLDAEDMTSCSVPDRLSILTYLSQFYQVFAGSTSNRVIHSRASESSNDRIGSVTETPQSKVRSRSGMCKELCVCCGLPVFLAEKLIIARSIYHRNCFRCKRCCLQLTSDNYHESDGGTYCDACLINKAPVMIRLEAPLSDEEKSKQFNFKHEQQQLHHGVEKDNNVDSKFDHMIRIINNKIDEFTSEREKSVEQMASPIVKNKREPRDNDAYVIVECRKASDGRDFAMSKWQTSSDPRTNNQKRFNEYITEDPSVIKELTKRLSLIHYHPKDCEEELKLKSDHDPDVMTLPRVNSQQIQETYLTSKDDYLKNINPFALSNVEEAEVYSKYETQNKECSTNPFDTTDEEMILEETKQHLKAVKTSKIKRLLEAPQINLNPFWNDNEEQKNNLDSKPELKNKSPSILKPKIIRKKKTAPLPPIHNQNDVITNNDPIPTLSPRIIFRARKNKPAPVPPVSPKTTSMPTNESTCRYNKNDALFDELLSSKQFDNDEIDRHQYWNEEKLNKDEVNRNRQNLFCSRSSTYLLNSFEKNIESKCKRKKSVAPTPSMPIRRKIKVISMKDVKIELDQIEIQQQGLKKQGIQLEQIIRNKCESGNTKKDMSLEFVIEELILELFTLVNEKNELFRRQAELILLRRQQRLEEEHADIEYQVRCLIRQPKATKTDFDKQQEEILIQRLMKIVEKRNEIVECLEMDRKREIEEDQSIYREIDLYAARSKVDNIHLTNEPLHSLKLKKGKFIEKKSNRNNKKDVDKDIDQSEMKLKRYNLRKWFYEYL